MSDTQVILEIVEGRLSGNHYHFDNPARILIGSAYGCDIQLPDEAGAGVSTGYRCILDVDPPFIHVRELDDRHSTRLNGSPVGPPSLASQAESDQSSAPAEGEMTDGDELRIGSTLFRVHVALHHRPPDVSLAPNFFG